MAPTCSLGISVLSSQISDFKRPLQFLGLRRPLGLVNTYKFLDTGQYMTADLKANYPSHSYHQNHEHFS